MTDRVDFDGGHDADGGFTLIEIMISIMLMGMLSAVLAGAVVTTINAAPKTDARIDDARSTRALATWLSHDTTSAPPFVPEQAQGGMDIATVDTGDNNDCGGVGSNLLHLQWTESAPVAKTFVANYRFVAGGGEGVIMRYACSRIGAAAFSTDFARTLTSALDPASPPVVTLDQPLGGDVRSVSFLLSGVSGEQVLVETSSRNPADFFP